MGSTGFSRTLVVGSTGFPLPIFCLFVYLFIHFFSKLLPTLWRWWGVVLGFPLSLLGVILGSPTHLFVVYLFISFIFPSQLIGGGGSTGFSPTHLFIYFLILLPTLRGEGGSEHSAASGCELSKYD